VAATHCCVTSPRTQRKHCSSIEVQSRDAVNKDKNLPVEMLRKLDKEKT
jgi:hypothetical protein